LIIFWTSFSIIFFTYIGYAIIIRIFLIFKKEKHVEEEDFELPTLTFIVACYNEIEYIEDKIKNTLSLKYDEDKINYFFVTDGTTDNSAEVISKYSQIEHFHKNLRQGKSAAINRIIPFVKSEIVVLSDANTILNEEALLMIAKCFQDPKVGAVAGEKKIIERNKDNAAGAGEGLYWKYESKLKEWDSRLCTVVGAAGELFAIKTSLYENPPEDIIIEDFYLSMRVVERGYKVAYQPKACAQETASESIAEELKRKERISAGGIQAIFRLRKIYNIFKYGMATFQFIVHRAFRWSLAPICLVLLFVSNFFIASTNTFYFVVWVLQIVFYLLSFIGLLLSRKEIKAKLFFIPFYFSFMNFSVFIGLVKLISGKQSAVWAKSKRSKNN